MTLVLVPATVAAGAVITVDGHAAARRSTRIRIDGSLVLGFRTGKTGDFRRTVVVPVRSDGSYTVAVEQLTDAWRQVDHATLTVKNPVPAPPPVPPPPPPPVPPPPPPPVPPPPPTPAGPVISGVQVTPTATGAVVEWHVQPPSKGWIKHGLTPAYGSETGHEEGLLDFHRQTVTGYGGGILVNFAVVAEVAGQHAELPGAFTTVGSVTLPPVPPPPVTPPPPVPPPPPTGTRPFPAPVTTRTVNVPAGGDIQAAINAGDGARIVLAAGQVVTLSRGLFLNGRRNIDLDLNGSTIRCTGDPNLIVSSPILLDHVNSDIRISNGVLEGNNQKTGSAIYGGGENQQGVAIYGNQRIELANLVIRKTFGDGVYLNEKDTTHVWPTDIWIHGVKVQLIGRQGYTVNSGRRVLIEDCEADQVGMMVLDIEMDVDTNGVDGLTFRRVKAGTFGMNPVFTQWFAACAAQATGPNASVQNVTIADCEVTSGIPASSNTPNASGLASWFERPAPTRMRNYAFTNNRTSKTGGQGVRFTRIDGLTVYGNTQNGQPVPVQTSDCTNVRTVP